MVASIWSLTELWPVIKDIGILFTSLVGGFTFYFKVCKPLIKSYKEKYELTKLKDDKINKIVYQLYPNGGGSISDKIDGLIEACESLSHRQIRIENKLDYSQQVQKSMMDTIGLAYWESDYEGNCIVASRGLSILLGVPESEIMGSGWAQLLCVNDKDRIFASYMFSVKYKTKFEEIYSFKVNDEVIKVRAIAFPVMSEDKTKLTGMFGTIKKYESD